MAQFDNRTPTTEMPNALVTGATGFIGRRLCELLNQKGWTVIGCGRKATEGPWHSFISFDLYDDEKITFPQKIEHVFHLAGKAHALDELKQASDTYFQCNADGTRKVLETAIAAEAKSFTLFSSTKAMGEGNADYQTNAPITEDFPCYPSTAYGKSKLEAESETLKASGKLRVNIIRPCLVYGPKSKGNLTRMAEAISKNRFPLVPEFGNLRSVVHVDDLCRLAISIVTNDNVTNKTFIAAEPSPYSTKQIQDIIRNALRKTPNRRAVPIPAFKVAGILGDLIGRLRGKRFVFDSHALLKLRENAHYDGSKACKLLKFEYRQNLREAASCLLEK